MDFLNNTNIVVAIGFVIFVGIMLYFGVPGLLARKLDERAVRIKAELDEARELRDEAQTLLASYERRQKEVKRPGRGHRDRGARRGARRRPRPRRRRSAARSRAGCRRPASRSPRPSRRRCGRSRTGP